MSGVKRILTRFFAILARLAVPACLVVSLFVLVIWIRSFFYSESVRWNGISLPNTHITWRFRDGEGILGLMVDAFELPDDSATASSIVQQVTILPRLGPPGYSRRRPGPAVYVRYPAPDSLLGSLGFQWYRFKDDFLGYDNDRYTFALPFWAVFFLTMSFPLTKYIRAVIHRQREERIAMGLCPTCGTVMREDLSRCPGCDKPTMIARQV